MGLYFIEWFGYSYRKIMILYIWHWFYTYTYNTFDTTFNTKP